MEYRYYGFTNMYLSSIQVGIQNAHCLVAMGRVYDDKDLIYAGNTKSIDYVEWADNHKTMVCLNGGTQLDLKNLALFFEMNANPYAWGLFHEDEQSLNGCLTCVGIVLPDRIYENATLLRSSLVENKQDIRLMLTAEFTGWEIELMDILSNSRLAS